MKNQNFEMHAGDTVEIEIPVTSGGVPKNLEGSTIHWVMQKHKTQKTPGVEKSVDNGIKLDEEVEEKNVFIVTLAPGDTKDLTPGVYYHEGKVVDAEGNVSTVITGVVTINPSMIII